VTVEGALLRISGKSREHVFERYSRGKDSDDTNGVGLGLFITLPAAPAY
jgi:K+-sensing histidine kinase KdpD